MVVGWLFVDWFGFVCWFCLIVFVVGLFVVCDFSLFCGDYYKAFVCLMRWVGWVCVYWCVCRFDWFLGWGGCCFLYTFIC